MKATLMRSGVLVGFGALVLSTGCATKNHRHYDIEARVEALERNAGAPREVRTTTTSTYKSRRSSVPSGMVGTYMAIPTGSEESSALLVEKMMPAKVNAGSTFEYSLLVTNLSEELSLRDVRVTETMSSNFRYEGSTPAGSPSGSNVTWTIANLAPGESQTITVRGVATAVGTVEICATADYTPYMCLQTVVEQPALAIRKTGPDRVQICDEITYNIVVTNTGSGDANGVQVVDNLPSGLSAAGNTTFSVGTLAAGESKEFTVVAKANNTGSFTNTATATGEGGLRADSTPITTSVCKPVLDVAVTGSAKDYIGKQVTYTATLSNTGDCAAQDVVFVQSVPDCVTYVGASTGGAQRGSEVSWNVGTLEAGASRTFTMTVQGDTICTATTNVYAEGVCAPRDTASTSTEFAGIPAILLEVIDVNDPVKVGGEEIYTITATNQGSLTGTNVRIQVVLEDMTAVEMTGATRGSASGNTLTFEPLAALAPKAKAEWTVRVKANKAGDIRFKVIMNSDQLTRTVEETEATNVYE